MKKKLFTVVAILVFFNFLSCGTMSKNSGDSPETTNDWAGIYTGVFLSADGEEEINVRITLNTDRTCAVEYQFIGKSMENYREAAEQEFYALADKVYSVMIITFMDDDFVNAVQKYFDECKIIEGVIITGPFMDFYIEKEQGKTITWVNGSPRFIAPLGLSWQPFHRDLQVPGLRNVTIQAVAYNVSNFIHYGTVTWNPKRDTIILKNEGDDFFPLHCKVGKNTLELDEPSIVLKK